MNHCVPDFETDDDYRFPASSRPKRSAMVDEEIMELLWQNGQVVMQSQNQRSGGNKKPETSPATASREIRSGGVEEETTPCNLFMQEDEMASWLHYPIDDSSLDLYLYNNDLLYQTPPPVSTLPPPPPSGAVPSPRPPIPPLKRLVVESSQSKPSSNFSQFSRPNKGIRIVESAPSSSNRMSRAATQSTVVESNVRPAAEALESKASRATDGTAAIGAAGTSLAGREPETFELSSTSSPGGSGASASVEPSFQKPPPPAAADDRKRKGRDVDDNECHSEGAEFEYVDTKKQSRGSTATVTKRSRAAEVHNLSERRRRDRINEKMKALQELIPRCNKSDKASMLDEAIEYLKSLQMQVQMMSMGYGVMPMMFPGMQQYMPQMGMGMGMEMGMNRSMVPYPTVLPGPSMPNSPALGQRFQVPGFHVPQVPITGTPRTQGPSLSNGLLNSYPPQNPNQPRVPNFDLYQQHFNLHQAQFPLPQNQTNIPPDSSKPSNNQNVRNP